MKSSHKLLIDEFVQMASDGPLGKSIRLSQETYDRLSTDKEVLSQAIKDFEETNRIHDPSIAEMRNLAFHQLTSLYWKSRKEDPLIAETFLNSFTRDFPGVDETALLPRWASLASASLAAKGIAHEGGKLLVWQQYKQLFQSSNEFLCGLFPYLIILFRTSAGRPYKDTVFSQPYGQLIDQLSSLSGGDQGSMYLFLRLAQPRVRNAIAHGTIWLNAKNHKIKYIDGKKHRKEYQMDLMEFAVMASAGSHIASAYIESLAAIGLAEINAVKHKNSCVRLA